MSCDKVVASKLRGHKIFNKNDVWYYADTGELTAGNKRPCGHCGEDNTVEDYDGCIGTLPDVMNACCGHGTTEDAYIQFWDGVDIRGEAALQYAQATEHSN